MNIKEFIKEMQKIQEQHGDDLLVGVSSIIDQLRPHKGSSVICIDAPFEVDDGVLILADLD